MLSLFNICINPVNSKQEKKKNVYFDEIFSRNICKNKKCPYLCTRNRETYYSRQQKLFYGVMVTRQILVLKFQVRALVEQQKRFEIQFQTFFRLLFISIPIHRLYPRNQCCRAIGCVLRLMSLFFSDQPF